MGISTRGRRATFVHSLFRQRCSPKLGEARRVGGKTEGTFIQPLAVDVAAMKRVIEHMLQKRGKDDVTPRF